MKRVIFFTEYLDPPYDEGIKKTVYNLFLELDKTYELQAVCRYGFKKSNIRIINTNSLFLSKEVKLIIKTFKPDALIYFPFQSSTFASYLRLKILTVFAKSINVIFIALQPKPLKYYQQQLVKIIKPEIGLTPSPELKHFWDKINVKNKLIPLFTDLNIFKPLNDQVAKQALRKKYDLPLNATIISHMGHLNEGRNLKSLIPLQEAGKLVLIVGSSSTPLDAFGKKSLKEELLQSGIIILDKYIRNIEEIYQLSDIYIFPVIEENSSIGMPLSILEARACGIPVITTDYGSVKYFLQDDFGNVFYAEPKTFLSKVNEFKKLKNSSFIKTNVKDLNKIFYSKLSKFINN